MKRTLTGAGHNRHPGRPISFSLPVWIWPLPWRRSVVHQFKDVGAALCRDVWVRKAKHRGVKPLLNPIIGTLIHHPAFAFALLRRPSTAEIEAGPGRVPSSSTRR